MPDLDLLVERVTEFWSFLQKGSKAEAFEYVDPATRNTFLNREEVPLLSFEVRDIHLGEDSSHVRVTVAVEVQYPDFTHPVSVPITEPYIFREGTWFVQIGESRAPELLDSPNRAKDKTLPDEERALLEKELSQFTFTVEKLAWGEILQGQPISLEVPFHNGGRGRVEVEILDAPAWVAFTRTDWFTPAGATGFFDLRVQTDELKGAISGSIQVLLRREGVEDRRDIPFEGFVKTPVTFTPARLVLDAAGSRDFAIRNNTKQDIVIQDFTPPGDFVEIRWSGDRTFKAGSTLRLQIRWTIGQIPEDWFSGSIQMLLYDPLYDGRKVLYLQVFREQP